MRIILCVFMLALPCVIRAKTLCSDDSPCSEGHLLRNSEPGTLIKPLTEKALKVSPPPFYNAPSPQIYEECFVPVNCQTGTCCENGCCPGFLNATCCLKGCCSPEEKCCNPIKENGEGWCCGLNQDCDEHTERLCINQGGVLQWILVACGAVALVGLFVFTCKRAGCCNCCMATDTGDPEFSENLETPLANKEFSENLETPRENREVSENVEIPQDNLGNSVIQYWEFREILADAMEGL